MRLTSALIVVALAGCATTPTADSTSGAAMPASATGAAAQSSAGGASQASPGGASQAAPGAPPSQPAAGAQATKPQPLQLGNFSVSLKVTDLVASRAFYEALGFHAVNGDGKSWLIVQNDSATIGLFAGVLPRNSLTFNPGWDRDGKRLAAYQDVREIKKILNSRGIVTMNDPDPTSTGPASLMVLDPDGNPILIDQHVPAPGK